MAYKIPLNDLLEEQIREIYYQTTINEGYKYHNHIGQRNLYGTFKMDQFKGEKNMFPYTSFEYNNVVIHKIHHFAVCKIIGGGKQIYNRFTLPAPASEKPSSLTTNFILSNISIYNQYNETDQKLLFKNSYLYSFVVKFFKKNIFKYNSAVKIFERIIPRLNKKNVDANGNKLPTNALRKFNIYDSTSINYKNNLINKIFEQISSNEVIMNLGLIYNNLYVLNILVPSNKEQLNYIPYLLSFIQNRLFYLLYMTFSVNYFHIVNTNINSLQIKTDVNITLKKMKKLFNYNAGNQIFCHYKKRGELSNVAIADDTYNVINQTDKSNNAHFDYIIELMTPFTQSLLNKYNDLKPPPPPKNEKAPAKK